ncbi:MAG: efflux RND transporter periplasmic adaptor subunit [Acidobacteriia bacterium]|nr:efflux RND transporter periplasmic adaptor subunit [Terriglobia bacterium]
MIPTFTFEPSRRPKETLRLLAVATALLAGVNGFLTSCTKVKAQSDVASNLGAPPAAVVEPEIDINNFKVEHPEQFPATAAGEYVSTPELNVTGVVSADVSRQVQVPSLASGKVVEIDARLGDNVTKDQLLFKVQSSDIAGAYSDYRQAVKNELLARLQLDRAKALYDDGAYPKSQLEIAQNAEDDATVVLETTLEHLHLLGGDPDHPVGTVSAFAPVAGTITDQQITIASGVQALNTPTPFTISDLTHVWIVCDVYENDLDQVHLNEYADIRLNAYPNRVLKGRISNILPVMDPNIRTAKVRIEVENPGLMRLGMFVTATFHGQTPEKHAVVPATAILHLHDREWVYSPASGGRFRRYEVTSGQMLPDNRQEVISGIKPGQQVVTNALLLQDTAER